MEQFLLRLRRGLKSPGLQTEVKDPRLDRIAANSLLVQIAEEIFEEPDNATEIYLKFTRRYPKFFAVDIYGMLCLPSQLIYLTGDDVQRAQKDANPLLVIQGNVPSTLIESRPYQVIEPRLIEQGTTIQPLRVLSLTEEMLATSQQKHVEFPATEDELILLRRFS